MFQWCKSAKMWLLCTFAGWTPGGCIVLSWRWTFLTPHSFEWTADVDSGKTVSLICSFTISCLENRPFARDGSKSSAALWHSLTQLFTSPVAYVAACSLHRSSAHLYKTYGVQGKSQEGFNWFNRSSTEVQLCSLDPVCFNSGSQKLLGVNFS